VHETQHKSSNDITRTASFTLTNLCLGFISLTGLISDRDERPRTREGNFPFTVRENAAGRDVAVPKPRSSVVTIPFPPPPLISRGMPREGRGSPRDEPRYGAVTNCIIDLYGVDDWRLVPLMCAEAREGGFRKERIPRMRASPGSGTREESPGEEAAAR